MSAERPTDCPGSLEALCLGNAVLGQGLGTALLTSALTASLCRPALAKQAAPMIFAYDFKSDPAEAG